MKGFMIYETPLWGNEENTVYLQEVKDASYTLKQIGSDDITCYLEGIATKDPVTKATCNKDDTYDFEEGALIALMKKCGAKKAAEACCEAFPHETSGSIYRENKRYIKRIKELEKENERLKEKVDDYYAYNKGLIDEIDQKNHEIISLKALKLTNESLKKDNESFRKTIAVKNRDIDHLLEENKTLKEKFDKKVSDLRDQIHENSILIQMNGELRDDVKKLEEEKKHLEDKYERCQHILDARVKDIHRLEEVNEKLKLDCEKLQHGYIDTDMMFCGGRTCGKQYKALVELFKKLSQGIVDAAYKEAYNTTLPVWQKEVLNQMYGVYKESKEKSELPKRKEMWNDILACDCEHSKYVEVKKEDLEAFAKECNEKKIFDISGYEFHLQEFWFADDRCIFQIFRKPAGFICAKSVGFAYEDSIVDYLPPMRWDLFKKGRIVVKVDRDNYDDFYNKCEVEIGRKPSTRYSGTFTVYYKYEKELEEYIFHTRPYSDTIPYAKRVVNWEDVR